MRKIKQIPEDFIVKEINNIHLEDIGKYSYFILKKKNYNSLRAIETISNKLNIHIKNIGYAGNKDKNAITEQVISIKNGNKTIENLILKDIELKYLGKGNEKIFLGNLEGNDFTITIRNLEKKDIEEAKKNKEILMPNYFGPQRFSSKNHLIGKELVKKNFKEAIKLILETNSDFNDRIKAHLEKNPNDLVAALKTIPLKLSKLYVHSYQSHLFNKTLDEYIKINENKKHNLDEKIPIIGFGTEFEDNEINNITKKFLEEEKITPRDFIIRQIPGLSSEGDERNAFTTIKNFKIIKEDKDDLNKGKKKVTISFSLPKGSYATVLIENLFSKTRLL